VILGHADWCDPPGSSERTLSNLYAKFFSLINQLFSLPYTIPVGIFFPTCLYSKEPYVNILSGKVTLSPKFSFPYASNLKPGERMEVFRWPVRVISRGYFPMDNPHRLAEGTRNPVFVQAL